MFSMPYIHTYIIYRSTERCMYMYIQIHIYVCLLKILWDLYRIRNNVIILHLIPTQGRLLLTDFTVNRAETEIVKEIVGKLTHLHRAFRVSKSFPVSPLIRIIDQNNHESISYLLHIYLYFHFTWSQERGTFSKRISPISVLIHSPDEPNAAPLWVSHPVCPEDLTFLFHGDCNTLSTRCQRLCHPHFSTASLCDLGVSLSSEPPCLTYTQAGLRKATLQGCRDQMGQHL